MPKRCAVARRLINLKQCSENSNVCERECRPHAGSHAFWRALALISAAYKRHRGLTNVGAAELRAWLGEINRKSAWHWWYSSKFSRIAPHPFFFHRNAHVIEKLRPCDIGDFHGYLRTCSNLTYPLKCTSCHLAESLLWFILKWRDTTLIIWGTNGLLPRSIAKVSHTIKESWCYESRINGAELLEKDCLMWAQWLRPAGLRNWKRSEEQCLWSLKGNSAYDSVD